MGKRMYVITETFTAQDTYLVEANSKDEAERKFLRAGGDEDRGLSKGIRQIDHGIGGQPSVQTYTERAWRKLWSTVRA